MAKRFSNLRAKMPPERQREARRRTKKMLAEMPLHELRQARKFSQEALAKTLRQRQSNISKLERRTDMYVSTLRSYVRAMGGELDIVARFPDGDVHINQFADF